MQQRSAISVRLRCLSHLRDALGAANLTLQLPAGSTIDDLEVRVRQMLPQAARQMVFRVAVNQRIGSGNTELGEGDEVALLPPMQGG